MPDKVNLLHRLKIGEVSSVARGAGEGVKIVLMKIDRSASDVLDLPNFLSKDGSNIFTVAVQCGADVQKVAAAQSAMAKSIAEIEKNFAEAEQQPALETSLNQCIEFLGKLVPAAKSDAFKAAVTAITPVSKGATMTDAEKAAALLKEAGLQKTIDDLTKVATDAQRGVLVLKAKSEHQEYIKKAELEGAKLDEFLAKKDDERDAFIKEFPPKKKPAVDPDEQKDVGKLVAKALADNPLFKTLSEQLATLTKADKLATFKKQATDLGLPESHGEVMMKAFEGDADAIKKHGEFIKGLVEQARTGKIFEEFGDNNINKTGASAYDRVVAKGEELRKLDPSLSPQQARAKVMTNPANADLVAEVKKEEALARRRAA
jgi:hypothetical protein